MKKGNMDRLFIVGTVSETVSSYTGIATGTSVYQSTGLVTHISRRHPSFVGYASRIHEILQAPDYIGVSPNESVTSFELVKVFDDNILIGVKLDTSSSRYYVATLYDITTSKIQHRVASGRLKKI